jgi:dipeptidyl-peptidase-4
VTAYAGPGTSAVAETFTLPDRLTELGVLVASFETRGAVFGRLGRVEVDDQTAGVRALWNRQYVDRTRTGIFGTSYGGYVSLMSVLRYPDVFRAAASSSAVTDWRLYNALYTERHMGLLNGRDAGYGAASATPLARALTGRLLLYYGTEDSNVAPVHTLQLVEALRRAGKPFTLETGAGRGHTSVDEEALAAFFIDALDIDSR